MPAIRTKRYPSAAARPTGEIGRYLDAIETRLRALEVKAIDRKAAPSPKVRKKSTAA